MSEAMRAPPELPPPITVALAGDVMLGRLVNDTIAVEGFAYPWGNLLPALRRVDLFCINLECALTTATEPWTNGSYKPFYFRADPPVVQTLREGRVNVASIANNHIGDFGVAGLLDTVRILDEAAIAHAGAGANLAAARAPARVVVRGVRVAVVAFADYPVAWAATPDTPGLNYTPITVADDEFAAVADTLREARRGADLVICSLHWGPNMRLRPPPAFRAFAHRVVEHGADIVWGHSAHVVQGVEVHDGRLILYDTGDFIDDYAVDRELRNDLSALFLIRVVPPRLERLELLPVRIARRQVMLAEGATREFILDRIAALSAELGTEVEREARGAQVRIAGEAR